MGPYVLGNFALALKIVRGLVAVVVNKRQMTTNFGVMDITLEDWHYISYCTVYLSEHSSDIPGIEKKVKFSLFSFSLPLIIICLEWYFNAGECENTKWNKDESSIGAVNRCV